MDTPVTQQVTMWLYCRGREAHVRGVDVVLLHVAHDAGEGLLHLRMARHPHVALDGAGCRYNGASVSHIMPCTGTVR